jgi:hypothetical protein
LLIICLITRVYKHSLYFIKWTLRATNVENGVHLQKLAWNVQIRQDR